MGYFKRHLDDDTSIPLMFIGGVVVFCYTDGFGSLSLLDYIETIVEISTDPTDLY